MDLRDRVWTSREAIFLLSILALTIGVVIYGFAYFRIGKEHIKLVEQMILRGTCISATVTVFGIVCYEKFGGKAVHDIKMLLAVFLLVNTVSYADVARDVVSGIKKMDITVSQVHPINRETGRRGRYLEYEFSAEGTGKKYRVTPKLYSTLTVGKQYTLLYLRYTETILDIHP